MKFEFERGNHIVFILLMLFSPLLYNILVILCSVNVPVQDDYALLGFINEFSATDSISTKIDILLSLHSEHRIAVTRAFVLLIMNTLGDLDFRWLNIIGNLALVPALVVMGWMIGLKNDMRKWALMFLIVLQPHFLKLMFYPMAAVQAFWGILFSLLYLFFVLNRRYWWLAFIWYALAVLTSGSGMFVALVGIVLLVMQGGYRQALLHLASALATFWLYAPKTSNIEYVVSHISTVIGFFLYLLGSSSQLPGVGIPLLSTGLSITLLAIAAFFVVKEFRYTTKEQWNESLPMLGCMLYVLLIISLIAVGRAGDGDLFGASLDGRYRIYSQIFLALCCLQLWKYVAQPGQRLVKLPILLLALACYFNLHWYYVTVPMMVNTSRHRNNAIKVWLQTREIRVLPIGAVAPDNAQSDLVDAINSGRYSP